MIYEMNTIMLMKRGYTKGDRDPDRRRFFLVPQLHYRLFQKLFETEPPKNGREILDYYFTAYFNAWLNFQGRLHDKDWITAFVPRLAHHEASVAGFFSTYPDGRLIQVIRDPWSWYPSARQNQKSGLANKAPDEILAMWCATADSILRNKAKYGRKVIVLRFQDLVGATETTMRLLASELGIAYQAILAEPTFNGESIRANSSFAVEGSGVIEAPLARDRILTQEERRLIEQRCHILHEKVLSTALVVSGGTE
jgi:hypothetical protein